MFVHPMGAGAHFVFHQDSVLENILCSVTGDFTRESTTQRLLALRFGLLVTS
ncbi:MAG: hypothetical protein ACTJLK_02640 [Anaplasma sp.]